MLVAFPSNPRSGVHPGENCVAHKERRVFLVEEKHIALRTEVIEKDRDTRDIQVREAGPNRRGHIIALARVCENLFRTDEVIVERGEVARVHNAASRSLATCRVGDADDVVGHRLASEAD